MKSGFSFYRFSFKINMIAVIVFTAGFIYFLVNPVAPTPLSTLHAAIIIIAAISYLVADLAGLSLVKRLSQNLEVSWRIINGISILIFIQFLFQLVEAYRLIQVTIFLYSLLTAGGHFAVDTNTSILGIIGFAAMMIAVISGFINIYGTTRLLSLARKDQIDNHEMIESIGSDK